MVKLLYIECVTVKWLLMRNTHIGFFSFSFFFFSRSYTV